MTLNDCGRRSPAPCLEAGVSALCCKPWVVQRLVCVLQLGAAAVRAAERVRLRRWLHWRWSFPGFGSAGKKALGAGLFAVRLSNRHFLTWVSDSVTKATGDCWGCNWIFHTDSYANLNMCSWLLMGHLQTQPAPFRNRHLWSGSLIARGFIVRLTELHLCWFLSAVLPCTREVSL